MNYNICKATINELDEIYNLQNAEIHTLISYNSLKEDLTNNNKYYLIAKNASNVVLGVIGISLNVDHADIIYILVKNEYKNIGIGSNLLSSAIKYCQSIDITNIFLEVRPSNNIAIKLYENFGFEKISIRKNYYPDNNEDAYIYIKDIAKL